jgi:hypothetical protein
MQQALLIDIAVLACGFAGDTYFTDPRKFS